MSNSWEYTESSIFFEWILNQVHSFKNMEHPAKICDDNEEILSFKKFVQIGFKFMAGLEKKFEPGFLSDSKLFEKKKI